MKDNILILLISVAELTNIIMCYTQILKAKLTEHKIKICLVYAGIILCHVINICYGPYIGDNMVNMFYGIIAISIVAKSSKVKWIVLYPCAFMIESIVCVTISYLFALILNESQQVLAESKTMTLLITSAFWILMAIKKAYNKVKNNNTNTLIFTNAIYVALTVGSLSFILILSEVQYFTVKYDVPNNQMNLLGLLLSGVCIVFFLLFFWLATTTYKNEAFKKDKDMMELYISEQEKYIKLVIEKDSDMRKFRHDVKEHMWVVMKCLEENEYEQAKNYMCELYDAYGTSEMVRYTGTIVVDAIISEKKRAMEEKNIKLIWDGNVSIFPSRLELFDICTLFVNILNNAMEACELLEKNDKIVNLKVVVDDKVYITESNRYIKPIEFDGIGNPITTKKDYNNHGYGSKNIRGIVDKYNGELQYSVDEKNFRIEIII